MAIAITNHTPLWAGFIAGRIEPPRYCLTAILKGTFALAAGEPARTAEPADRELLQGDYAAFYTAAFKAARVLMRADQALHNRIAASLERIRFSSEKPSAEDADNLLQQFERALKRTP